MSSVIQDVGRDPWADISKHPIWRSRASPNARILFCLYYRQMFDQKGKLNPEAIGYTQRLWLRTREKQKWQMLEALVKVIHTIQSQEGVPLVHPCVILHPACQILKVVPPSDYLGHCSFEPEPLTIDLPILFKRIALGPCFMGIAGRYMFRYYLSVYFATVLQMNTEDIADYGVMSFVSKISTVRSRTVRTYFLQLGNKVLWG
uniref:Mating-type protein MAT1-2-7 n=1 Tax=Berkeleyomyces basicola TaxID=124036 RepID=A0A3G2LVX8_9PEZI|nr:mating-type protein MAT1-2-7 [Berkeleyomyces basicola]